MDNFLNYDRNFTSFGCNRDTMNSPFLYDLHNILHIESAETDIRSIIYDFKSHNRFSLTIYCAYCMTYNMASITKKMIRDKPYYYARECKRVNGKPKIVWQQYLGRPEDIINAMTRGPSQAEALVKPKEAVIND
jgi:hypothetical protein